MEINKVYVCGTLMKDMHNHRRVKPFIKHLETAKTLNYRIGHDTYCPVYQSFP